MSAREKVMCYWGIKFEDYMTTKSNSLIQTTAIIILLLIAPGEKASQSKSGGINPNESFCTVVRTRLNTHSLVMAGEVDCVDHVSSSTG